MLSRNLSHSLSLSLYVRPLMLLASAITAVYVCALLYIPSLSYSHVGSGLTWFDLIHFGIYIVIVYIQCVLIQLFIRCVWVAYVYWYERVCMNTAAGVDIVRLCFASLHLHVFSHYYSFVSFTFAHTIWLPISLYLRKFILHSNVLISCHIRKMFFFSYGPTLAPAFRSLT